MAAILIVCERVRVEEKQIMSALADRGLESSPLPPAAIPGGIHLDPTREVSRPEEPAAQLLIDRCPDRSTAGNLFSLLRSQNQCLIDGGLASHGSRLDVSIALADSSIPIPPASLVISEAGGMSALRSMEYPCTLFPMTIGRPGLPITDDDIAEAALEHRHTIGSAGARSMLAVFGAPTGTETTEYVVVNGKAISRSGDGKSTTQSGEAAHLAIRAAAALQASALGVRIAQIDHELVVWDVSPNPEFRRFVQIGDRSTATAFADLVLDRISDGNVSDIKTPVQKERGRDVLIVA
ncbi:hypothetical protein BH23CHL5_BH23CHL5_25970 [soil metagenome]